MRRMLLPIIKKYWKLLLSAMLVSALGCGIMVGMSGAYLSLQRSLDDYVADYRYPSAIITTDVANRSKIDALKAVGGISAVNARLCGDTVLIDNRDRYLSVRVFIYNDDDIQKFHAWQSADCGEKDAVKLEYNFAVDNGIKAGDTLVFRIGDEFRSYAVEALVSAPETLSVQITDDSWGSNTDYGYAYAHISLLEKESKKEYDSAKNDLDDKENDLDKAQQDTDKAFDDIKNGLDDALKLLEEKDALFADALEEADEQKKKLNDTAAELRETKKTLEKNLADLADAEKQLKEAEAKLPEAIKALEDGIALADDAIDKLLEAKAALSEIDRNIAELESKLAQLKTSDNVSAVALLRTMPQDMLLDDIFDAEDRLDELIIMAAMNGYPVDESMTIGEILPVLKLFVDTVEHDYVFLGNDYNTALIERARNGEDIRFEPGYISLATVISRYDNTLAQGGDIVTAYDNAYARCSYLHEEIHRNNVPQTIEILEQLDPNMTIRELRTNVAKLKKLVNDLRAQGIQVQTVGDVVRAYDNSVSQLESAISQLRSQRAQIVSELQKQGVQEKDIDKKVAELRSQKSEAQTNLEKARQQLAEVREQLAAIPDARAQLIDGIQQVDDGLEQIAEGIEQIEKELEDAREQLDDAHEQYEKSEKEYESGLADSISEFGKLREELEKAYAQLDETEGYEALCNQFMLYFDPNADHEKLLSDAKAALGDDIEIKKSFVYADSAVKHRIDINLEPIDTMSTFMPMVFFVVILIVVFLFMSLVIRQCRREIGILRALGFTSGSIRLLYCGVDLVISILAIVLGIGIGVGVMRYVGINYKDFFPLPEFTYYLDYKRVALAAALTIVVGQAATLIGTTVISKIAPSEAMTRPAPVSTKMPKLLDALMKKAKPLSKFSVSSMLRNKGRFVFSVICVAASVMMIFSSFAFITSKNELLKELYTDRIHYDCQLFFKEQPDEKLFSEFASLDYVSDVQPMRYYESELDFNGKTVSAVVNSLEEDTELVQVFDKNGARLGIPHDGIILEAHSAEELGAGIGDTVKVDGVPFKVEAISEQSVSRFQYISESSCERLDDVSLGCLILNIGEANEARLLAKLTGTDSYLYSVFTRLAYEGNMKTFKTYDVATMILIGFAILIGFTIVFNTTQTNLLERKKELCVLRTLGFQRSQLSRSWFSQSLLQFVFSLAVGLPSGIVIAKIALEKLSTDGREYVFANGAREYIFTALIVFAYIALSHVLAMRSLKRWDLVENVKEKE